MKARHAAHPSLSPTLRPHTSHQTQRLQTSPQQSRRRMHNMQLPNLPRFHPANYNSSHLSSTTDSGHISPGRQYQQPLQQHYQQQHQQQQQRQQVSDAQRQLYLHQRELMALNHAPRSPGFRSSRPASPHLSPLGSPGPVTPLELEEKDGYFLAGAASPGLSEKAKEDIVEAYIRNETQASFDHAGSRSQHSHRSMVRSPGHRSQDSS